MSTWSAAWRSISIDRICQPSSRACDKSPRKLDLLACRRSGSHTDDVRMSFIRRIATLLFALAFIASAQANAMPMMSPAKVDAGMAVMGHGSLAGDCKGCGQSQSGAVMTADCSAACAPLFAVVPHIPVAQPVAHGRAWLWTRDALATRATAPDTSPPRT